MVAHDHPAATTAPATTANHAVTTAVSVTGVRTTAEHHAENSYECKCP